MKRRALLFAGVLLLLAVSAAGGFYLQRYSQDETRGTGAGETPDAARKPAGGEALIGRTRPDFRLPDLSGRERRVSEWDGRILVVNFWATWCPPCLEEIPEFIELQSRYGDQGLQFVGIALQKPSDVVDFAEEHGINYPVLAGEMAVVRVAEAYGNDVGALPYTVVIDRAGKIVFTHRGPVSGPEMMSVIRPLL